MSSFEERAERLAAQAATESADRPVDSGGVAWRPAENDDQPNPLIGTITGFGSRESDYGTQTVAYVRDGDGTAWSVWLTAKALKRSFTEQSPAAGQMVYIHFQGKRMAKSGHQYYAYHVQIEQPQLDGFEHQPAGDTDDVPF